ncbi:hypothetical protein EYC59_00405 [Candidatus Saccharibacteria bacterium]|nr:MAG: hypothetical protein EYC59_00405 [Candidatus Saccharibacteria bacterium]
MANSTLVDPDSDEKYAPVHDDMSGFEKSFHGDSAKSSGTQTLADRDARHKEISDLEDSFNAPSATESGSGKLGKENASSSKELASKEENAADNKFNYNEEGKGKKKQKGNADGFWNKKRAGIAGGITGVALVGGGMVGVPFVAGPLQFVHAGKLLSTIHFSANEDFGDSRSTKTLIYAVTGVGAERGRLGPAGNKAADIWEAKLEKTTGLKPIYSSTTRRFVGYQITDPSKVASKVGEVNAETFGEGSEVKSAAQASAGRQGLLGPKSTKIPDDARIIDLRDVSFKDRRVSIRTVGKSVGTNKVVSTISSRLLITRYRVNFHALPDKVRQTGDSLADRNKKIREDKAKQIENGVKPQTTTAEQIKDKDGKVTNADAEVASDDANKVINEASSKVGQSAVKDLAKTAGKGGVAVGILCAVKGFGDHIPDYKYTHNIVPMIRMGMDIIAMGNQVMSGKGVDIATLGALHQDFYDPVTKTSFFDAQSIRANTGQDATKGVPLPAEANLKNTGEKPWFFNAVDSVPGLGLACGALAAVGELPVLKQVSEAVSAIGSAAINVILSPFNIDIEKLMEGALSIAAGKAVNSLAQGGERGALADTGAFLASNDNMMAMGGVPLTTTQAALVNDAARTGVEQDKRTESIAERYLDPYDYSSLVGSTVDAMPQSANQLASTLATPLSSLASTFKSFGNLFVPRTLAASLYDYGVPQFGFTIQEQQDERFEDPYENAVKVEGPDGSNLQRLNEKYGKCFGMTVNVTDSGVQVQSANAGDENLNQIKIATDPKWSECHDGSEDLLRYRFYLADAIAINSNNCFIANDEKACASMGADGGAAAASGVAHTNTGDTGSIVAGSDRELAGKLADQDGKGITFQNKQTVAQLKAYAANQTVTNACGDPMGVSPYLSGALISLTQSKYKLIIEDIGFGADRTGCERDNFQHPKGNAVDIQGIEIVGGKKTSDGLNYVGDDGAIAGQFATDFLALLPADNGKLDRGGVGQKGCNGLNPTFPAGSVALDGAHFFIDSCDHLHIDVRNRTNLSEAAGKP